MDTVSASNSFLANPPVRLLNLTNALGGLLRSYPMAAIRDLLPDQVYTTSNCMLVVVSASSGKFRHLLY